MCSNDAQSKNEKKNAKRKQSRHTDFLLRGLLNWWKLKANEKKGKLTRTLTRASCCKKWYALNVIVELDHLKYISALLINFRIKCIKENELIASSFSFSPSLDAALLLCMCWKLVTIFRFRNCFLHWNTLHFSTVLAFNWTESFIYIS